ncbi:MAG: response regulator [Thermodesulfobacteriota bacterium]|nr:response regulator [Thermodesulfobacteriota bacterium]
MTRKILIVDDEFFITRSLSFMLKKEGYHCDIANDGQKALENIGSEKPDLIFLDVDMPVKNGYETAREIRQNPAWKDIHIIMLSAKGQDIDEKRGLEAGANEYILKPFDPRAILARVREILI